MRKDNRRLKKLYKEKTLYQKVRWAILLFSVPSLICLAIISLTVIYRSQISKISEASMRELQNRYDSMNYKMDTIELMAKTVWSDTTFVTEVGKASVNGGLREYDRYFFQTHTLSTLKVITGISEIQSARIHLDYPELKEYFPYMYSMDRAKDSLWYEDRETLASSGAWYMNSTDEQTFGIYSNYFVGKNRASYVIPVRITSSLTGVFEIILPMDALVPDLYKGMDEKEVFLLDSKERILGLGETPVLKDDIMAEELADIMGYESFEEYDKDGVSVFHGWWNHLPVILSAIRDEDRGIFLMQIDYVGKKYLTMLLEIISILVLEIFMVLLLIRAINGIVRRLLHDFDTFNECIREAGEGNLDVKIPSLDQMEMNMIAREYNRMLNKVKNLMEISIHREVMVKEAQLKSLEKQIDSHFLYNVLDSIGMMAEVKGIYNISDALRSLGRMFRYNLQINSHSVTLREEIIYLEDYLKLCNIRYDYCINLSENIDEAVKALCVPKVILQPIAENSIVHGLDEMAEDTAIYLKAYVSERCCYIEMTDMGKGMDETSLEKVRQGIYNGIKQKNGDGGIGLNNIHERICLMYGEKYGMEIYSKESCYTKVVLKIPVD